MKRLLFLLVCGVSIFMFNSCQSSAGNKSTDELVAGENGQFPQSLAGTWKADASKWQVTLAPDGNVVSIVNTAGFNMVMAEGGMLVPGRGTKKYLYFIFGPSSAKYNPKTRELNVNIIIENFHMQVLDGALEGDIKYYLTGPVSKDGKKWDVELFSYAKPKGLEPTDPKRIEPEILVFRKMENNQPPHLKNQ